MEGMMSKDTTRPIAGIENRTAQEVFDIMCDRLRLSASPAGVKPLETVRHKKRGTTYEVIGVGKMQAESWTEEVLGADEDGRNAWVNQSIDMREVAVYRSADDGQIWVRSVEEFNDGRFAPARIMSAIEPAGVGVETALRKIADEISALKLHPTTSEDYDAGYIGGRNDAFAIVQEVIDNLPQQPNPEPLLTSDEMKEQAIRCSCHGSDDYCPCQNVPDAETRRLRAARAIHDKIGVKDE